MKNGFNPVTNDPPAGNYEFRASMQPIIFNSCNQKLLGTLFIPQSNKPEGLIVLLHGYPGNENNFDIAHMLRRQGYNVIVFHYRGTWGSENTFSFKNCFEDVENVIECIYNSDFAKQYNIDIENISLVGHSMGGFAAIFTANKFSFIKNIVAFGTFNFGILRILLDTVPQAKDTALTYLSTGCQMLNCPDPNFLFDEIISNSDNWNIENMIENFKEKKLLLIGAKFDSVAPIDFHFSPIVKKAINFELKNFDYHLLETGHSFSNSRIKLMQLISNWFYLNKEKL